jgi:hypothetical protein
VNADNPARQEKYGQALEFIEQAYSDVSVDKASEYMAESMIRGPEIFMYAYRALPVIKCAQ